MDKYVTLIGTEQMQNAARQIQSAADRMQAAVDGFAHSVHRLENLMVEFQAAIERAGNETKAATTSGE
jgi:hypothetical protein